MTPWFEALPAVPPGTCGARRNHPLSSDYWIRCERENGHAGEHLNDSVPWFDNSPYALPGEPT